MGLTKLLQYEHHCDQTSEELPSRKLVVKSPGPVKYLDFAIAVIIWSPLRILVSGEVWMRLLVVEVAGKVMEELWMFPAEQSHPLLVPHVALVSEQELID